MQDSFLGLLDSLPLYAGKSSLWTYLVAIARHEIADHYRKLYAKKAIRSVPFVDQVYDEPLYSGEETREVFEQVMTRLSQEERLLLEWKYDLGLSVKQIATKMGLDFKAAESRLFRARKQFQVAYLELTDP